MTIDSLVESKSKSGIVDPDIHLIAQAKDELPHRTNAYETLMRKYEKLLYRVCFRIMGNQHDAEDVFQDVMVKVFNGLVKFQYRSSFKTWLFTIAHNTCYSSISRYAKSREFKRFLATEHEDEQSSYQPMSDAQLESERVMSSLSNEDRELLTLKYAVELNFDEIAQITGMGTSAVKMRIYRARESLETKFGRA